LLENIEILLYDFYMRKSEVSIKTNSVWNTSVPSALSEKLPYFVSEAGHFCALPDYSVSREYHDSFLLLYTLFGMGRVSSEGREFDLPAGAFAVIDCRTPHAYKCKNRDWEFIWIHFSCRFSDTYFELIGRKPPLTAPARDTDSFSAVLKNIVNSVGRGDTLSLLSTDKLMTDLFFSISEDLTAPEADSFADSTVRKISEYINENFSKPLNLAQLSAKFNMSKYYLIRSFTKIMGVPPYNYLLGRRIGEAKKMLAFTSDSVSEIAEKCGFSDSAAFIACFKSHEGRTPLKYRKEFRS